MKRTWLLVLASLVLGSLAGSFVAAPLLLQGKVAATAAPAQAAAPAIPKELTSYRDIVKQILPAVVSIEVKSKPAMKKQPAARRRLLPPDDAQVPEEFRRFFEQMPRQAPADEAPVLGFGSGFLVDPKGVVLTNHHVVDGADTVEVQLKDGRKFVSKDIKVDAKTDLAIVRIQTKEDLPYLELGDSDQMEIGDRVLAIGAPFGLTGSVTHGIISAKGRSLHMNMYEDFLQTDAAINPGNSGGPLVNLEGKVIGINAAIKSRSGGFQGIGLAIASNLARNVMRQLEKDGVVHRGYLGVQIKELIDRDLARRLGVGDQGGVLVTQVFDSTPAAKAGVRDGDVITSLGGKPVREGRELQNAVAGLPLGKPVELNVVREGQPKTLHVTVEEQPADYGTKRVPLPRAPRRGQVETTALDGVGADVADLTPELAKQLGYGEKAQGVVVAQVEPGSAAAEAGLARGMLIVQANRQPVESASGLKKLLTAPALEQGVLLQVKSPQGGTNFVVLRAAATASK